MGIKRIRNRPGISTVLPKYQACFSLISTFRKAERWWRLVEGDTAFLEGLRLIETPGHSAAHISILTDTKEGVVCIAGDACCTLRNLIVGSTVYSPEKTAASYDRIRRMADHVLPGHEPEIRQFQREFPKIKKSKSPGRIPIPPDF